MDSEVVVGVIVVCEGVVVAPHAVYNPVVVRVLLGSAEHEMFEKVSEPCKVRAFVAGTYTVKQVDSDKRRGVVAMQKHA